MSRRKRTRPTKNSAQKTANLSLKGTRQVGDKPLEEPRIFSPKNVSEELLDRKIQTAQRLELAAQIGQIQGNKHWNRLVLSDISPANMIFRNIVPRAEQRAGTAQPSWPGLDDQARQTVQAHISNGNRQEALDALVNAVVPNYRNRTTWTVSDQVSGDGDADPYVLRTPACGLSSTTPENHWQLHNAQTDLRVRVRINPSVFQQRFTQERLIKLYTTVMHEYTHVDQIMQEGIHNQTRFRNPVNGREYLMFESTAVTAQVGSLHEIDASASEIENASVTNLAQSSQIISAVHSLWRFYQAYRSAIGRQNVNQAVAERVYRNIHRGRQMLIQFMQSPEGQVTIAVIVIGGRRQSSPLLNDPTNVINSWLYRCPMGYSDAQRRQFIESYVSQPVRDEVNGLISNEATFRGTMPTLAQEIEGRIPGILRRLRR